MGVPIIENWSTITGVIQSLAPSNDLAQFVVVTVAVDRVDPVDGFANLLADAAGHDLDVLVPQDIVQSRGLRAGQMIICRVRRAGGDRIFVQQQFITVSPASPAASAEPASLNLSGSQAQQEPDAAAPERPEG
jgi:hypothetical protein